MLDAPRTDPDEPDSSIRLLPRGCDGEAPLGRLPHAVQRLNPTYLAQLEPIFDGLRKAGVPER